MVIIKRIIRINLPKGKSAFLWGPRKTGKTTYLKETFPKLPANQYKKDNRSGG